MSGSRRLIVAVVGLAVALVGCRVETEEDPTVGPTPPSPEPGVEAPPHVIAFLEADGRFQTLLRILREGAPQSFLEAMRGPDWDQTLFAPTDEAFDALPPEQLQELLADSVQLTILLEKHIVPEVVPGEELVLIDEVETIGGPVDVGEEDDKITFGPATVTEPDIQASNGVIHAVDAVILP